MTSIPLTNVSSQYSARFREAIRLIEVEHDRAIALLEEMVSEPFVPIFWVMQINVSLCYRKSPRESWEHYLKAAAALRDIEERWPETSGAIGAAIARQKANLKVLEQELPRLIERQRQAAETRQQELTADDADSKDVNDENLDDATAMSEVNDENLDDATAMREVNEVVLNDTADELADTDFFKPDAVQDTSMVEHEMPSSPPKPTPVHHALRTPTSLRLAEVIPSQLSTSPLRRRRSTAQFDDPGIESPLRKQKRAD